jgi:ADP-dependent NAD(P)H-hydrate dehydratase / NAD(P)H-hydrate epimerase
MIRNMHSSLPEPSPPAGRTREVRATAGPWPLHDTVRTRALEQAAQALAPRPPLMARAGLALARLGRALAPHAQRTVVLVGPGNNGGDGLVAARLLYSARDAVQVRLTSDPARLPTDAAQALRMAASAGVEILAFDEAERFVLSEHDLVIDALLGIGSQRAPEGPVAAAILACQDLRARILAVDLPSGLHPDTGALLGEHTVRAQATLALLTIKPGCFTAQGRDHAGQVWWDDLGLAVPDPSAWLMTTPQDTHRAHAAHKGRFGDVWVLGGAPGMEGALVLAAHAALAAGCGRVLACALQGGTALGLRAEIMRRPLTEALQPGLMAAATAVVGCGGGSAVDQVLPAALAGAARLVLDADALNVVAASSALQQALSARSDRGQATVLTPHPLEAARLLGCNTEAVQADRLTAADRLARRFQAIVVLKGSGSVVAASGRTLHINPTGNAALGTAGTGDVLAGWLGGLWAQAPADAQAATLAAVWAHGAAADRWRHAGHGGPLRAADLIEAMAQI